MTCWPLRNLLLPLLWEDVEGCISHIYYNPDTGEGGEGSHLHAQCIYLCLNPEVATYVRYVRFLRSLLQLTTCLYRTFSVNLHLQYSPPDLMNKFVDCLVRLPNLKTLEILNIDPGDAIPMALERELATFTLPSVRKLRILPECHNLVENCPNLESLIFTRPADERAHFTILSRGQGLKCIGGMSLYRGRDLDGESPNGGSTSPMDYSKAYNSGCSGLPKPSGDRHLRLHRGKYSTQRMPGIHDLHPHHSMIERVFKYSGS